MAKSIVQLVDELSTDNITTKVLHALDFVVPGEWTNLTGFDHSIEVITGQTNPDKIAQIRAKAIALYDAPKSKYQGAIGLYQTIDKADTALGAAALANKIGEKIGILGFLNKITPKADTTQTIDIIIKLSVEILAYCKLYGLPNPSPKAFVTALNNNYRGAALMRMAALVCVDGLLPLGPDFMEKVHEIMGKTDNDTLQNNPTFTVLNSSIPGDNTQDKLGFITQGFDSAQDWMKQLINRSGLTQSGVFKNIGGFIQFADDNLDFVAAFVDQTTNYFEHTGIQTVAQKLILDAYAEVQLESGGQAVVDARTVPKTAPAMAGATTLEAVSTGATLKHLGTGKVFSLPSDRILHLGKPNEQVPPEIDVSGLPNADVVSRMHANIWFQEGSFQIVDVGSSNGTAINDQPLTPKTRYTLKSGDRLSLGRINPMTFTFET